MCATRRGRLAVGLALLAWGAPVTAGAHGRLALEHGWSLRSSAGLSEGGAALSQPDYAVSGWHAVRVPNTVVGALVENGTYPDPYFGMNLRSIPGTTYPVGTRFTLLPTPDDSPFKPSWWYRARFELPRELAGRALFLHFDGINYRAAVWVNGTRVAGADEVVGAFRRHAFDVTRLLRAGAPNAVAVEVFGPEPHDLSFMWVDWNPTPADKNMGLWDAVYLSDSGPLALRDAQVESRLELPGLERARLTVTTEVWNTTDRPVSGVVRGAVEALQFARRVTLAPRERAKVRFSPDDVPGLELAHPRVWWPYRWGAQHLYTLTLDADVEGAVSDRRELRFGIRRIDSELTDKGHRLFRVNGLPLLVRGGGWASDMLLRPKSRARLEAELRYVREMGLNTIRLEGKLESDLFYDLADEYGILVMPGWCCCDQWEMWDKWDDEDHRVGPASVRDQALRLRHHPSVLAWLNGSDFPPPERVERAYLDVLAEVGWPHPVLSNATEAPGPLSGPSGMKMRGPYDYVPPSYWLTDTERGGAFGFASEIGPGAAVPPLESLRRMLPAQHLWPIDEVWNFHAGGDEFKDVTRFTQALEARYGRAGGVADYARKAQALAYEGQRAMFEAWGRNKYTATGVIQWMLNNAWPSLIWHLYDYYLRPGGGYYGTKKACEPLHVQYSYDDRSVVVVNDLREGFERVKVVAQLFDLELRPKLTRELTLDVPPDGVVRAFVLPKLERSSAVWFLRLRLIDAAGRARSSNFYWLSPREDVLDWKAAKWFHTPTLRHADLSAIAKLPPTTLALEPRFSAGDTDGDEGVALVNVSNRGKALAFQVHLKLVEPAGGDELLPVFWDDNYFELLPGETREVRVVWPRDRRSAPPAVEAVAWNAARVVAH